MELKVLGLGRIKKRKTLRLILNGIERTSYLDFYVSPTKPVLILNGIERNWIKL